MSKSLAALPRTAILQACSGAALAMMLGQGFAQTAPRYTAKNLPKVTAAQSCSNSPFSLNEAGDVAQSCIYSLPTYTRIGQNCYEYLGNVCFSYRATVKPVYGAPAVWLAGASSARPLTSTTLSDAEGTITNGGAVVGYSTTIDSRGIATGSRQLRQWLPPYNAAGTPFPIPATLQTAFQSPDPATLNAVLPSGSTWWSGGNPTKNALVTADGQLWLVPELPAPSNPAELESEQIVLSVQDGQQAVRSRWLTVQQSGGLYNFRHELWYVRGQQATPIPLPVPQTRVEAATLSNNGRVLFKIGNISYSWNVNQPATVTALTTAANPGAVTLLNDSGLLAGSAPIPNDSQGRSKARIWVQGQGFDLQGLTSGLASGLQLRQVVAMNQRGQLVVTAQDTSLFGGGAYKTLLLTPQ